MLLDLDFAQCFGVGIDWNSQGSVYLQQDHRALMYSVVSKRKQKQPFAQQIIQRFNYQIEGIHTSSNHIIGT